jgi:hypothetical protein
MKTRTTVIAIALALLVTLTAGAQTATGVVDFVQGDVRVNGVPVDFGDAVGAGDWVQTGEDGQIDVVFDRRNIFRLGPNTVAVLNLGDRTQNVDLKTGTFAAVFDRVRTLAGRGTFDVTTPTAAGGVRGTSFFMRVVDRDTTYVCTCNGTLEYTPFGAGSFLDSATAHSAFLMVRNDDGTVSVERSVEQYHNSDSLNIVAERIDVVIPWGQPLE